MSARRPDDRASEDFARVLEALHEGDGVAFEHVFRSLAPVVAGYLRMQGAAEPDDLTNEVFLGVFRNVGTFEGDEARFRSWVFTIAHRRLTDERRRRGRGLPISMEAPADLAERVRRIEGDAGAGDTELEAMGRLGEQRVRRLCDRLLPDQRDVLLLRVIGDLTIEQIATTLGRSIGATKALQRRGLLALRRELEREGVPL